MGAICWNKSPRRLAALLMTLSLFAGCQDSGSENNPDPQEENKAAHDLAIAVIHKVNGNIYIDETTPGKTGVKLDLRSTEITDAGLERLTALSPIVELYLNDTRITDAGLVHLKGMKQLQRLYLNDTKITDAGLPLLSGLNNLQMLTVGGTKVTEAGIKDLQKALPKLKVRR
jgi:Leucine-rich repeat (LRR) protein